MNRKWIIISAGCGLLALCIAIVLAVICPQQFFAGYLAAFAVCIGFPVGCAVILMVHHLTGGKWGWSIRNELEPALVTFPLIALAFIPIFFGIHFLYEWAHEPAVEQSHVLQHKKIYLNNAFFIGRTVFYFLSWLLLGYFLLLWSYRQRRHEQDYQSVVTKKLLRLSAGGLVLYFLTMSFAAIDWLASL